MEQNRKIKKGIVAYCIGDIYGGGAFVIVGMLFLRFLTDSALISAGVAGTMLLVGKLWDAGIDPFIGNLTDRSKSKHGRRRVFFLAGIFHVGAGFLLLWLPIQGSEAFKTIYYLIAYLLFAASFSFTMVPYHAYLADISKSYEERNKTVGIRTIISNLSSLISGVVPLVLISMMGWLGMAMVFSIFYTIPWIIVFIGTRAFPKEDTIFLSEEKERFSIKNVFSDVKSVMQNRSYRLLLGIYIFAYVAIDIFMAVNIYYLVDYLKLTGTFLGLGYPSLITGIFIISQVIAVTFYIRVSNNVGKRQAFIIGAVTWVIGFLVILIAKPGISPYFIFAAAALMGLGGAGVAYAPWGMLPEASDVEQLISHQKKEGSYSGVMTFGRQLAQALALFVVGIYLDVVKYNGALEEQAHITRMGIKYFYTFAPIVLLIIAIIFTIKYPVTRETYKIMQNEIELIKKGDFEKRSPKTEEIIKKLTGKK